MTKVTWDDSGKRYYEAGVDRGVLYLLDGTGVPWNGLISVEEDEVDTAETPLYFDGIKYDVVREPGDFSAKLVAFTYPDEFLAFDGYAEFGPGFSLSNQPVDNYFGLSYRTMIGNETKGSKAAYKIHILYNLSAIPDGRSITTLGDRADAVNFSWVLSGIPLEFPGMRPSCHVIIDTRRVSPDFVVALESFLYGGPTATPKIPTPLELMSLYTSGLTSVTNNGDGTFTVVGPDANVYRNDSESYVIKGAGVTPIGDNTYVITDGK